MKLSFLILSILLTTSVMSQNLSLAYDGNPLSANETIYIWGDSSSTGVIYCYLEVTNNGTSNLDVLAKKTEINILSGTENSFCWGACYSPMVFVSPNPLTINAGETNSSGFSGDYMPNGFIGMSTIRYTFFNSADHNDSVAVNVVYGSGTASVNDIDNIVNITAYPNPANEFVNFSFKKPLSENAQLVIFTPSGSEVFRSSVSDNFMLDLSKFDNGVYFYTIYYAGKTTSTKRLIVAH